MKNTVLNPSVKVMNLILAGVMGLAGAGLFTSIDRLCHPVVYPIATVDVTGLIHDFVNTQSHAKLTSQQQEQASHAFGQSLDQALKTLAHDQKKVILPKEAVVSGAPDLTEWVEKQIQTQLPVPQRNF